MFVVQAIWELEVVTGPVCMFVMTRVVGGGGLPVLLALLTKPAQPLNSAAEELKTTTLAAHTHPLRLVFTVLITSGLCQLVSWGRGWGPRNLAGKFCPNFASRIGERDVPLLLACRTVLG